MLTAEVEQQQNIANQIFTVVHLWKGEYAE